MSAFDNSEKDELEMNIRIFLENHTIDELKEIIAYCIDEAEGELLDSGAVNELKKEARKAANGEAEYMTMDEVFND